MASIHLWGKELRCNLIATVGPERGIYSALRFCCSNPKHDRDYNAPLGAISDLNGAAMKLHNFLCHG